jgi:predicted glycosyltransferase
MRETIRSARWSVNQCGYNVAVDIIETGTPALFVPCPDGHRLEQITRAQRLVYWGAGRLLMPQHLNGASLANDIHQLTKFKSREISFDSGGAAKTADLISEMVFGEKFASISADHPTQNSHN